MSFLGAFRVYFFIVYCYFIFFFIFFMAWAEYRCCVVACADVSNEQIGRPGGPEGNSAAARAARRGNRRLTRNESRYHSGKSHLQITHSPFCHYNNEHSKFTTRRGFFTLTTLCTCCFSRKSFPQSSTVSGGLYSTYF